MQKQELLQLTRMTQSLARTEALSSCRAASHQMVVQAPVVMLQELLVQLIHPKNMMMKMLVNPVLLLPVPEPPQLQVEEGLPMCLWISFAHV